MDWSDSGFDAGPADCLPRLERESTVYRFSAAGTDATTFDDDQFLEPITFSAELVVAAAGIVRQANVRTVYEDQDGETFERDRHYEITNVGTATVEEPDWVHEPTD